MKEINKSAGKTTLDEQDKTDLLDESTREVVDEYSRKFLIFIQQEKDRARRNALSESEKIIAEVEKKGRLAYEKAIREANAEAENIITNALNTAKQITADTDKYIKLANEITVNAEKEIEHARSELQKQLEKIGDFYRKQDEALNEISVKLREGFESSFNMLNDLKQGLEQPSRAGGDISSSHQEEATVVPARVKTSREDPVNRIPTVREEPMKRQGEKSYVGTINLDIYRKNPAVSKRFRDALAKVPGFEISLVDDSGKDHTKVVAYANHPLPILNILHQMSLVRSAIADEDTIKIVLQEGDTWVG